MNKKIFTLLMLGICTRGFSCTTIIVGKKASANGAIMFGRNSDTNAASRAKHLRIYPQDKNIAKFLALPYYNTEDKDGMLQVATNGFGVAMSATETITSSDAVLKADPYIESGISEFNVTKPIMQQAKTAKEAIIMLGAMIEKSGSAEGFGIAIADKNEAWYLENAGGHHWVAVRVPDDTYFVTANQSRIQEIEFVGYGQYAVGYLGSNDLVDFAKMNGLYKETHGKFDFRQSFARIINKDDGKLDNDVTYNYMRIATLQNKYSNKSLAGAKLQTGQFPTFLKPTKQLSLQDIEDGLSNYYKNTVNDPYTLPNAVAKYRPISVFRSSNSHVTLVRDRTDQNIANIEYIAMGMPSSSIYIPFYFGITSVPHSYAIGDNKADNDSAFWKFRKLQALVFTDYRHNQPIVKKAYANLARRIEQQQEIMEQQYQQTHDAKIIQKFTEDTIKETFALTDNLTIQLENYYATNHNGKPKFNNDSLTKLTNDVFDEYRFPGF